MYGSLFRGWIAPSRWWDSVSAFASPLPSACGPFLWPEPRPFVPRFAISPVWRRNRPRRSELNSSRCPASKVEGWAPEVWSAFAVSAVASCWARSVWILGTSRSPNTEIPCPRVFRSWNRFEGSFLKERNDLRWNDDKSKTIRFEKIWSITNRRPIQKEKKRFKFLS